MEGSTDLCEEDLEVFATQILLRSVADLLERLAAGVARLSVYTSEGDVVVARLEIGLLLFRELQSKPRNNCWHTCVLACTL